MGQDSDAKYEIVTNYGVRSKSMYKRIIKFIRKNIAMGIMSIFGVLLSLFILICIIYKLFASFSSYAMFHRSILQNIYKNGPNLRILHADLGFWNGKDVAVICRYFVNLFVEN